MDHDGYNFFLSNLSHIHSPENIAYNKHNVHDYERDIIGDNKVVCKKDEQAEETYHKYFQEEFFPFQEEPEPKKPEILIKSKI